MPKLDPKQFATEIRKTGFVLENQVAQSLKASGWTVISNKYYVDDSEETVREIDLVAYRVSKIQHFLVYTVLIISCKKSESNAWALLARGANLKDPNADRWPLHAWSNDKALQFQLAEPGKARSYHEQVAALGVTEALSDPTVEVFAFQEMDKTTGKPQNDKPIFSAVTSLMKAQAYELSALPARKNVPCVYQFNLISVVDTELLRLMFSGPNIVCSELETQHYLARYIIRKRESFSRIHFVRASAFDTALQDYGRLHKANCKLFGGECDSFYSGLVEDWKRSNFLVEDFKNHFFWRVGWLLERQFSRKIDIGTPYLSWSKPLNQLNVGVTGPDESIAYLNEDDEITKTVARSLKLIYRYEGAFAFTNDVPF